MEWGQVHPRNPAFSGQQDLTANVLVSYTRIVHRGVGIPFRVAIARLHALKNSALPGKRSSVTASRSGSRRAPDLSNSALFSNEVCHYVLILL